MDTQITLISPGFAAIDQANLQPSTKAQYSKALRNYLDTGHDLFDVEALVDYAARQRPSTRSFLKAAIRLVIKSDELKLKGAVTPDTLAPTQAALLRFEAIQGAIAVSQPKGTKAHTWLSAKQVKQLMQSCDLATLPGRRDWVILALLVGAGLRREELVDAASSDLVSLPTKKGMRTALQITGKGAKQRTVPLSAELATRLSAWITECGSGNFARSLGMQAVLGSRISAIGIFGIVRRHGRTLGLPDLDPHDLRRTYAQLGLAAGVPLTQISRLLGHSSIKTTQAYLNLELDLESTVSDFVPLG